MPMVRATSGNSTGGRGRARPPIATAGRVGAPWDGRAMNTITVVTGVVTLLLGFVVGHLLATNRAADRNRSAQVRLAQANARLEAEARAAVARVEAMQADHARLSEQFRALAADALAQNNEQF